MRRPIFLSGNFPDFSGQRVRPKKRSPECHEGRTPGSMDSIEAGNEAGPYYLSYQVDDAFMFRILSEFGAPIANTENRARSGKDRPPSRKLRPG